jgi:uncharacterized membrane protein
MTMSLLLSILAVVFITFGLLIVAVLLASARAERRAEDCADRKARERFAMARAVSQG